MFCRQGSELFCEAFVFWCVIFHKKLLSMKKGDIYQAFFHSHERTVTPPWMVAVY